MMQKNTVQASLPNVANKPKFSTLNQQLKGAGALKQGTGRATQSGQGSRYLVLAPAGRGRGRGSTKAPAPIAPQPLNLPSIKSESNVTKSSSWGAQDKPANETKDTEVATNQSEAKTNSAQNVNNNANDTHGDGAWSRPKPMNDQDYPPPSRYQPPRRDEDRFSLRKDEFPSLKDQPPKEPSSPPHHQYERPNYSGHRDYNNSNGYDRRSDYGREQRRPSESDRYVGNNNRVSRYSRDERPPRYENEENRSYGNVTIKSKEPTPHPESHIKVESVHRSFIATPKDWALEAEEDTERVQREDTEK
jgi:hypothetical protein